MLGTVLSFNRFDGHTEIAGADGKVYWSHRREFVNISKLPTGTKVEFTPLAHPRGLRATRVHLAEAEPPR
jgi:cold shock CspA family protein